MNIGTVARILRSAQDNSLGESIGLVAAVPCAANDYRVYDETDVETLRFVQRARSPGFSVADAADLLALWRDQARASPKVKTLALARIGEVDRKVREPESLKRAFIDLAARRHGDDRQDNPIVDEFAGVDRADVSPDIRQHFPGGQPMIGANGASPYGRQAKSWYR